MRMKTLGHCICGLEWVQRLPETSTQIHSQLYQTDITDRRNNEFLTKGCRGEDCFAADEQRSICAGPIAPLVVYLVRMRQLMQIGERYDNRHGGMALTTGIYSCISISLYISATTTMNFCSKKSLIMLTWMLREANILIDIQTALFGIKIRANE